jgi:hypothetical protein
MYDFTIWLLNAFNKAVGLITFGVGFIAIYVYLKQKRDHKRDAALLILQEIRYAEQSVRNYKTNQTYSFTEKILPTSNWHKNIHLFVNDLKEIEIDLISKFYSKAAYLDGVISKLAQHSTSELLKPATPLEIRDEKGKKTRIATSNMKNELQELIKDISDNIEFIYNTPVTSKLRTLSDRKWFSFFF